MASLFESGSSVNRLKLQRLVCVVSGVGEDSIFESILELCPVHYFLDFGLNFLFCRDCVLRFLDRLFLCPLWDALLDFEVFFVPGDDLAAFCFSSLFGVFSFSERVFKEFTCWDLLFIFLGTGFFSLFLDSSEFLFLFLFFFLKKRDLPLNSEEELSFLSFLGFGLVLAVSEVDFCGDFTALIFFLRKIPFLSLGVGLLALALEADLFSVLLGEVLLTARCFGGFCGV